MLQHFSWTQFLISFALLSLLWYLALLLTVYKKEAFALLSGKKMQIPSAEILDQKDPSSNEENIEHELMGKSKLPEGLATVSMSAISFSASESSVDQSRSDQLGLVPDVLEELKEIFDVLSKEDGTKKDFISLVGLITEKYGRIGSSPNIGQINAFIQEHAPFAISNEELENLWD